MKTITYTQKAAFIIWVTTECTKGYKEFGFSYTIDDWPNIYGPDCLFKGFSDTLRHLDAMLNSMNRLKTLTCFSYKRNDVSRYLLVKGSTFEFNIYEE